MSLKMYSNLPMLNKAEFKKMTVNMLLTFFGVFFFLQVKLFACATQHTSTGNESFDTVL